jgi:hypothetical protein
MITMLLPLVMALAADPTPAPSVSAPSTPPPTRLQEIGRTRALPVCSNIVVHANSAITDALNNDQDLAVAINHLRTTDLDNATAQQHKARMADLMAFATKMRTSSSAGDAEVKRLRELAAASSDPERKAELKAFADALGGALFRQKRAADDLDKALVIMDGRRAATKGITDDGLPPPTAAQIARAGMATPDPNLSSTDNIGNTKQVMRADPLFVTDRTVTSQNAQLLHIADDLYARTNFILIDEGTAADHSLGATTGC